MKIEKEHVIYDCEPIGRFHVHVAGQELVFMPCGALQALCEAPGPTAIDVSTVEIVKLDF